MLLRSKANPKETKYIEYLNNHANGPVNVNINEIWKQLVELDKTLTTQQIKSYSKDLYDILKFMNINHEQRVKAYSNLSKPLKDLFKNVTKNKRIQRTYRTKIQDYLINKANDIQYKRKSTHTAYDDYVYYGLKDLEYIIGDLDDYYKPIWAGQSFNGNREWYICRGDPNREMYVNTYIDLVTPYLRQLIKENKHLIKEYNLSLVSI